MDKQFPAPAIDNRFAISVDVEDYFQVWAFSNTISRKSWDGFDLRVGDMTRRCLDLFDRCGAKATFFTLSWVAERDPALIREICERGHELASHGMDHTKVHDQSSDDFFNDARDARQRLEDISGSRVIGYRAAGFSIDGTTPWAYDRLAEAGYLYSSSSHPIAHDHYGDVNAPRTPHYPSANANIVEAPVATHELFGRRVSCAGGGWFRLMPYGVSRRLLRAAEKSTEGPIIFYFHPWEIDVAQPRIKNASVKSKFRHYTGLRAMERKLEKLAREWTWTRIDDVLQLRPAP